VPFL
jgi:RNA-directed DNA polymerase